MAHGSGGWRTRMGSWHDHSPVGPSSWFTASTPGFCPRTEGGSPGASVTRTLTSQCELAQPLWRAVRCACTRGLSGMSDSLRPRDRSPPGSSIHGTLWARILEWTATAFSKNSTDVPLKTKNRVTMQSCNSTPGHISRENYGLKGYTRPAVHRSSVYSGPDREATYTSTGRGMDKEGVVYYTQWNVTQT